MANNFSTKQNILHNLTLLKLHYHIQKIFQLNKFSSYISSNFFQQYKMIYIIVPSIISLPHTNGVILDIKFLFYITVRFEVM